MGMGEIIDKRSLQVILISRLMPSLCRCIRKSGRMADSDASLRSSRSATST